MRRSSWITLALVLLAACGVEAVDFSQKTCPCPADLACDTVANRCISPSALSPDAAAPTCIPKSCDEQQVECGPTNNGCGGFLDCGPCAIADYGCVANKCVCQPKDCAAQGADCGQVPSGCGQTFACNSCPTDKPICGGAGPNKCGTAACTPKTCGASDCGIVSDGCAGTVDCGGCTAPQVCGGGGVANQCGCQSKTCAQLGWQCGKGTDNCGRFKDCGDDCTYPQTCNASHVCASCTPATCTSRGWQCGSGSDGCGGTLNCGSCSFGSCNTYHQCDN